MRLKGVQSDVSIPTALALARTISTSNGASSKLAGLDSSPKNWAIKRQGSHRTSAARELVVFAAVRMTIPLSAVLEGRLSGPDPATNRSRCKRLPRAESSKRGFSALGNSRSDLIAGVGRIDKQSLTSSIGQKSRRELGPAISLGRPRLTVPGCQISRSGILVRFRRSKFLLSVAFLLGAYGSFSWASAAHADTAEGLIEWAGSPLPKSEYVIRPDAPPPPAPTQFRAPTHVGSVTLTVIGCRSLTG